MSGRINLIAIFSLHILLFIPAWTQQADFDIVAYQQFLKSHQDLSAAGLMEMYPAGLFEKETVVSWESALYHDSIEIKYDLSGDEISLLQKHGFLVTERLSTPSFGNHFLDIWWKDLPVFISSDAILFAFHFAYDRLLSEIEKGVLIERLTRLLKTLHQELPELAAAYADTPALDQMLRDVDIYLTVPLLLLGEEGTSFYPQNSHEIPEILNLIENESPERYPLFSSTCKEIDFSQFKPRGHYADDAYLSRYFKALMWLGRIEIYLLAPQNVDTTTGCPAQRFTDIQRQTIDAFLIRELMERANAQTLYDEIEEIISFFVGEQDNITLRHLDMLNDEMPSATARSLLDSLTLAEFQNSLREKSYTFQRIQSQLLYSDPLTPESVEPAAAFMLFGQRYVIDSYVTAQVVYDKIVYQNESICRLFPSTLDILFTLGNNAAGQLLKDELEVYKYSSNLSALRYLVDSYDVSFWTSSIYNMWLHAICALNPPAERQLLPSFMQTAGWWQQKMNTQLAAWSELRHDNLLYAKPSYTSGIGCSFPYSYVEPVPDFFRRMKLLAGIALEKFQILSFSDNYLKQSILGYFTILQGVSDTLETVAWKELNQTALSTEESLFLRRMLHQEGQYGNGTITGWYGKLLYGDRQDILGIDIAPDKSVNIVADYHTTPTDCYGSPMGWVSHAGTGPVDLAIVVAKDISGKVLAYSGPVSSFYEYRTTNFQRLTDSEWNETYQAASTRPDWVNLYLADRDGQSAGEGPSLITALSEGSHSGSVQPSTCLLARNYPNPFNPSTIINFVIPSRLANSFSELIIFDIRGRAVRHLVSENLPAGNYLCKWDGTGDDAVSVASGLYIYRLRVGTQQVTGKMQLLR